MLAAIGSIFVLSWDGLTHFGEKVLGLDGWMVHIVPGSLDGSVIMFGCMAIVSMIAGENATGLRFFVQLCAVGSAVFNGYQGWISADKGNRYFAGAYYACLSLLVALIAHWFFRRIRRAARIEDGTLKVDTVHFSMAEWTKFPIRRWKARTLALEYGITDPRLAITLEASKNGRIDARIMHALEAHEKDESTRVYEFFGSNAVVPNDGKPDIPKSLPVGTFIPLPVSENGHGNDVENVGNLFLNHGNGESQAGKDDASEDKPDGSSDAQEGMPDTSEIPRNEPENETRIPGQRDLCSLCGPADSQVPPESCSHSHELSKLGNHSEAVEYAVRVVGMEGGTVLSKWLNSHGYEIGKSSVYRLVETRPGTNHLRIVGSERE
ncbi:hypothetical protein [Streptomyces sp. NPDC023838]|uniref:hypothetical protein n=1 Tax=Streptomyces sp. NPDC023838 TaxID=3154325 RepID=UPI00340B33E0